MHYLWRAVDQEGEVLESYVTKTRDKTAALAFMKRALKRHGSPEAITTDGLRSYRAAMSELRNTEKQEIGRWANNRVENSHLPFRRRERAMLRFRQMKSLQKFASVHANVHNHFNLERHPVRPRSWTHREPWRGDTVRAPAGRCSRTAAVLQLRHVAQSPLIPSPTISSQVQSMLPGSGREEGVPVPENRRDMLGQRPQPADYVNGRGGSFGPIPPVKCKRQKTSAFLDRLRKAIGLQSAIPGRQRKLNECLVSGRVKAGVNVRKWVHLA
jgi:putative transposase